MSGNLTVKIEDVGTDKERLVVLEADEYVQASPQLAESLIDRRKASPHVRIDRDRRRFTVGTEGEGLGVVTYEVGSIPDDTSLFAEGRWLLERLVELRRVVERRVEPHDDGPSPDWFDTIKEWEKR